MNKRIRLQNLQIKTLVIIAGFLMITAFGVGTINYIENNSYVLNQAKAADDSTNPVNPGGGGLDIPKGSSSTSTSGSTTASTTSTTGTTTSTSGSTTSTSGSTTSTTATSSNSGTTTSSSASTTSGSTTSATDAGNGKTPVGLPNGESDVLVINKDKTIASQTNSSTPSTTTSTATTATKNLSLDNTVRTGGLEVTLATLAVVGLAGFAYYYKKHVHHKGGLKTSEKKIHHK